MGRDKRPFAAFTLDDGYKDNREFAFPVFKKFNVPFTIYVPTDFAEGRGDLWWLTLEESLRRSQSATLEMNGTRRTFHLATAAEKDTAFNSIYWWLRQMPEDRARAVTHRLAREAGFDHTEICSRLVMRLGRTQGLCPRSIGEYRGTHAWTFCLVEVAGR